MKSDQEKKIRLSFTVSLQEHKKLKLQAVSEGLSIDSILKGLLKRHFEELDDEFDRQAYIQAKEESKGEKAKPWNSIREKLGLDINHV